MKILKLGGSVITKKAGYREPNKKNITLMAKTVAAIWKKGMRDFVLVHGAGSFGHALVVKHGINEGVKNTAQKLGYADTHAACSELSLLLVKALVDAEVPAISIPPALIIGQKDRRILRFDGKIVQDYLTSGYLPVLYGDMVPDIGLGGSVCSGDQIVAYLGKGAEFVVLATNVDGVFDDAGNLIPEITTSNFDEISKHLKDGPEGGAKDVTGAMKGKLMELLALDTTAYIVNAAHPERIEDLMFGKATICTKVKK